MRKKCYYLIFTVLLFSFKVGFSIYAQDNISLPDYTAEQIKLEQNYDNILDYTETKRCLTTEQDNPDHCTADEPVIVYIYNSKIATDENVISKNTVRIDNSTLKIYSGDTFYADSQIGWTLIETGYIIPLEFNKLQAERTTRLTNPFKIYSVNAQVTYSGSGDGDCYNTASSWDNIHNEDTSDSAQTNLTYMRWGFYENGANDDMARSFIPFNTYALDDDKCIASATLTMKTVTVTNGDYVGIVQTTQDDSSALATTDYDECGEVHDPEEGTDTRQNVAANATVYNWELNDTGLSWISTSSYTLLGARAQVDLDDSSPGATTKYGRFYTSEQTGTGDDPYLTVGMEDCPEPPEEETATTTAATPGLMPVWNDISVISGYAEEYTDSTTTPSKVIYYVYHIPFFVWCVVAFLFSFFFGRFLIELLIWLRGK